ncbi:methyl-accepting chemotaxis protein [Desulfotomaculum sp. 1211_IL3151]|uniref:methyl-accepting chemotaxis protein n=1 Tax=Desulfotomaculum sp. 1211_IL3151 TaxID=3084055 RepID=UPI002FD8BDF1
MNWFYNLKIATKLTIAFIIVALVAGIIGYIGISNIKKINEADNNMYEKMTAPMGNMAEMSTAFQRIRVNTRDIIISNSPAEIQERSNRIKDYFATIDKNISEVEKTILTEEGKELFRKYYEVDRVFRSETDRLIQLAMADQDAEALAVISENGTHGKAAREELDIINRIMEIKIEMAKETAEENSSIAASAVTSMLIIILVGVLISIGLGLFIARIISRPIKELAAAADKLALGDVNVDVKATAKDEVGMLAASFKSMAENIKCQSLALAKVAEGDLSVQVKVSSENDVLGKNLSLMVNTIKELVEESNLLVQAAVEGRLETRGQAAKFKGGYYEIVKGVNDTLDAVLRPINEAVACLQEMAKGNLDTNVNGDYLGDHAMIKEALNSTIDSINQILSQVTVAVDQVAAGSRQISEASQALSQGATESASAVEQISSSMQEMASQTSQNAENAMQANQLAVLAKDNAENGNQKMVQMVKAMTDINESANGISKIIKVIDEIAFQTNLLALNAAVEAARAGKHGKGFTVVAEEVRNLAQRSAKAAKETTEMIEDSIKRTEVGTQIAQDTSKSLEGIVNGATKVTDLISEIAAASKEQAQGIGQINAGLSQVDQVTQQNTASAEQSAAAGEELSGQAVNLKEMLGHFRLSRKSQGNPTLMNTSVGIVSGRQSSKKNKVEPSQTGQEKKNLVRPQDIISLDDSDFGKF